MKNVFKVYINDGEWQRIQDWVLQHNNIETGGDLFGLWIDERTAVVQFVLGPGEQCRRTATTFYQDVEYLANAGNYLTSAHGLCNIGQWHSHHRIKLFEPSPGDNNTVWTNMPKLALDRYIVFIANIDHAIHVSVGCFLYERKNGHQLPLKGQLQLLEGNSPLRLSETVGQNTYKGAEQGSLNKPAINTEKKFVSVTSFVNANKQTIHLPPENPTVSFTYRGQNEFAYTRGTPNQKHNAQHRSNNLLGTPEQHEDDSNVLAVSMTQNCELRNDKNERLATKNPHPSEVSRNGRQTQQGTFIVASPRDTQIAEQNTDPAGAINIKTTHNDDDDTLGKQKNGASDTTLSRHKATSLETKVEKQHKPATTVKYQGATEKPEHAKKNTIAEKPRIDCSISQQRGMNSAILLSSKRSSTYDNMKHEEMETRMDNKGKIDANGVAVDEPQPRTPSETTQPPKTIHNTLDEENDSKSMLCGLFSRRKSKKRKKQKADK